MCIRDRSVGREANIGEAPIEEDSAACSTAASGNENADGLSVETRRGGAATLCVSAERAGEAEAKPRAAGPRAALNRPSAPRAAATPRQAVIGARARGARTATVARPADEAVGVAVALGEGAERVSSGARTRAYAAGPLGARSAPRLLKLPISARSAE